MQLHPAPAETLVQLMGKGRRMAKVPLPAALAGKGLGEAGQVRQLFGGDMLGGDSGAVVGEEGLRQRGDDLLMIYPR
ncbi:hypothetical protein D3C79_838430 [compost metagenome]